jgi:hypothetical protein
MTCSDVIYTSPLSDKYPKFTLEWFLLFLGMMIINYKFFYVSAWTCWGRMEISKLEG